MLAVLGSAAVLVLPGLLLLRGRPWLALPASLAFWTVSWSFVALTGANRSTVLGMALYASASLLLVAAPRLGRDRIVIASAAVACCGGLQAMAAMLPEPHRFQHRDLLAARLLSWRDGIPVAWAPLARAVDPPWPTGLSGVMADLLLVGAEAPAAVWIVMAVAVALVPLTLDRPLSVRLVAAAAAAVVVALGGADVAIALGLVLAAARLLDDHAPRWPSTFGATFLWGAALIVQPFAAVAALPALRRHRWRAARPMLAAVALLLPLLLRGAQPWSRELPSELRALTSVYTAIREPR
jgi:hypothetical protein